MRFERPPLDVLNRVVRASASASIVVMDEHFKGTRPETLTLDGTYSCCE